jgi:hypothetical protein
MTVKLNIINYDDDDDDNNNNNNDDDNNNNNNNNNNNTIQCSIPLHNCNLNGFCCSCKA